MKIIFLHINKSLQQTFLIWRHYIWLFFSELNLSLVMVWQAGVWDKFKLKFKFYKDSYVQDFNILSYIRIKKLDVEYGDEFNSSIDP